MDQDSEGLTATAQLNITVLDYNDHAPQFPSIPDPVRIPEGDYSEESPGAVLTIVPTDPDLGPNGEVTLSLPSPHPLFRFGAVRPTERIVGMLSSSKCRVRTLSCCVAGWDTAGCRPSGPRDQGDLRAAGSGLGQRQSSKRGETAAGG